MDVLPHELDLDCPLLDGDHALLLWLIRQLERLLEERVRADRIRALAPKVAAYFDAQFEHEAAAMEQSGFADIRAHMGEHRALRAQLDALAETDGGGAREAARRIVLALETSFSDHVKQSDRALAAHLRARHMEGTPGEQSRLLGSLTGIGAGAAPAGPAQSNFGRKPTGERSI
jgi:hemerythrin-like metal-binding protein